jgi:hypothetical protein
VLARQARQLVESRYTWNSIAGEMERVWGEVARPPAA